MDIFTSGIPIDIHCRIAIRNKKFCLRSYQCILACWTPFNHNFVTRVKIYIKTGNLTNCQIKFFPTKPLVSCIIWISTFYNWFYRCSQAILELFHLYTFLVHWICKNKPIFIDFTWKYWKYSRNRWKCYRRLTATKLVQIMYCHRFGQIIYVYAGYFA